MEIKKQNNGIYEVSFDYDTATLEMTEEYGYYYCNSKEFDSYEAVIEYCEKLQTAITALYDCKGWLFDDCGRESKNASVFTLYSVCAAYLDTPEAVQLFAKYTEAAYEAGILQYAYEPALYCSEAFLVLDEAREEYEPHRDEDYMIEIFKTITKRVYR